MTNYEKATTQNAQGLQAIVGLTGFALQQGDVRMFRERLTHIELPEKFTANHVALMRKDLAIISGIAEQQPEDLLSLNNAVLKYDLQTANRLAQKIGLTEENMLANGGNIWGLIIIIAIGAALLLESDSPHPPAPEPAPDGGTG